MSEEDDGPAEPTVLKDDDAVALWKQGREAWNAWVEANPCATIDFSGVDFSEHRTENELLSFWGMDFGDGDVSFRDAAFGNGGVSFADAAFGNGGVSFADAAFGNGGVSFLDAAFGDGSVFFADATFGDGEVLFAGATFGDGGVFFNHVAFGDGGVSFHKAAFGDGNVFFNQAVFGGGDVSFELATFGDGNVFFNQAAFGDGNVIFNGAAFGDGDVSFLDAAFGDGGVWFRVASAERLIFIPKTLSSRVVDSRGIRMKSVAEFDLSAASKRLETFSFRNAAFGGALILRGALMAPPDLRGTRTDHHVDLTELQVALPRYWRRPAWPPALSPVAHNRDDSARLRRLKEIAEANRDHAAALRFSADENRAKRWVQTGWLASVLDMSFSGLSDYGQSIWRPTVGLAALTGVAASLYSGIAEKGTWPDAVSLATGTAMAFVPQSRTVRDDAAGSLFGPDPGLWIDLAMMGQAVLSFVFLFLIGLGLRNRFRL